MSRATAEGKKNDSERISAGSRRSEDELEEMIEKGVPGTYNFSVSRLHAALRFVGEIDVVR